MLGPEVTMSRVPFTDHSRWSTKKRPPTPDSRGQSGREERRDGRSRDSPIRERAAKVERMPKRILQTKAENRVPAPR